MALEVTWQNNPPEKLLKERFHINTGFHPGQRDIIEQLVRPPHFMTDTHRHSNVANFYVRNLLSYEHESKLECSHAIGGLSHSDLFAREDSPTTSTLILGVISGLFL